MTFDKHKNSRMTTFRTMTPKHYDVTTLSLMIFSIMAKLTHSEATTDTSFYYDTEHNDLNFNNTEHNNIQHKCIIPMAFSMAFRTVTISIRLS